MFLHDEIWSQMRLLRNVKSHLLELDAEYRGREDLQDTTYEVEHATEQITDWKYRFKAYYSIWVGSRTVYKPVGAVGASRPTECSDGRFTTITIWNPDMEPQ